MNCYSFEKRIYEKGLLEECIDATYIIHLENNGRFKNIMKQLDHYQLSKITYILFNKGYKNCKKHKNITKPPLDLIDAFLTIFKHANQHSYNNILILEDDIIFDEEIKDQNIRKEISNFINSHSHENFHYLLGCIPFIQIPKDFSFKHYSVLSAGCHACIYTKKNRIEILKTKQNKIKDWDLYYNLYVTKYTYYKPLCYQLFPNTENSKYWQVDFLFLHINKNILKKILNFFHLDKEIEPGYSFFYFFSKFIYFLLVLFIFFLLLLPPLVFL